MRLDLTEARVQVSRGGRDWKLMWEPDISWTGELLNRAKRNVLIIDFMLLDSSSFIHPKLS